MKRKIEIIIIALIAIIGILVISKNININNDTLKFKKEYEKLNNTIRESDGAKYNNVNIPKDNRIKYINAEEAVNIIENKTGVIYLGAPWCPWCRNAVEVLIDVAKKNNIKNIYYVDMDETRNIWEIQNSKLVKTKKEQSGYYDLLKALDSVLNNETYTITDDDGNIYDTKEKRIYMPLVVTVKDGKIIDNHVGTVSLRQDQTKYDKLTYEQYKELFNIYNNMIDKIK